MQNQVEYMSSLLLLLWFWDRVLLFALPLSLSHADTISMIPFQMKKSRLRGIKGLHPDRIASKHQNLNPGLADSELMLFFYTESDCGISDYVLKGEKG